MYKRQPSRKVGERDSRGSHFHLALYWAEELAKQTEDAELAEAFKQIAGQLRENVDTIDEELLAVQGDSADIGGYYLPEDKKASAVMRPSKTLNEIMKTLEKKDV